MTDTTDSAAHGDDEAAQLSSHQSETETQLPETTSAQSAAQAASTQSPAEATPSTTALGAQMRTGPLTPGQRVQLIDYKSRKWTITLQEGGEWHTHQGVLRHDTIIGGPEGVVVTNEAGYQYQVLRPLLNDFVLSMPRGATVVYPKDSAQIVQVADIFPGARVLEAGVGSGALSISLLRAIGETGALHSYELRDEFADIAEANVEAFFGAQHPAWEVHRGDATQLPLDVEEPGSIDRLVLDMLAPWDCMDMVKTVLAPGGVWVSYVASVTQLSRLAEAIRASEGFTEPEAHETMLRTWHLDGLAVRPDHRMVAHTGFLLSARRLADGQRPLPLKKREKVSEPSPEDRAAWPGTRDETTDGEAPEWDDKALKNRTVSKKKARRTAKTAQKIAEAAKEVPHD